MPTVVEAARTLGGEGVHTTIVGAGQELDSVRAAAEGVRGLELVPRFEPPERIAERLRASHVGLGVFGDTDKAGRVVPFKAVLTMAAGRALVTRDSSPSRTLGDAALRVPAGDPQALAAALAGLRDDRALVRRLAAAGRAHYEWAHAPQAAAAVSGGGPAIGAPCTALRRCPGGALTSAGRGPRGPSSPSAPRNDTRGFQPRPSRAFVGSPTSVSTSAGR